MFLKGDERFADYARDESRRSGSFEWIAFPDSLKTLQEVVRQARKRGLAITVQGARTGITGGAVPDGGCVICLERMNRILRASRDAGRGRLWVQPGITLGGLRKALAGERSPETPSMDVPGGEDLLSRGPWFFAPDPTEPGASLGGMAACNASGARGFFYGPMRRHINALRVVLADGDVLDLRRGRDVANEFDFSVRTENGNPVSGTLPDYRLPGVKNASGYYSHSGMDVLDIFIGSEGTLGILAELELNLLPLPPALAAVVCFPPDEAAAVSLAQRLGRGNGRKPAALEYFDPNSLDLLRREQEADGSAFPVPGPDCHCALYVEYQGAPEDVEEEIIELSETFEEAGIDPDNTWMADNPIELRRFKDFRHAIPEVVNRIIDRRRRKSPGVTKLGTDFAVPPDALGELLRLYRDDLQRDDLEYVIFGHIGDHHLHLNILPRNQREYDIGRELYDKWAGWVVDRGGSVSAEHGVGKLKTGLLLKMFGPEGIASMRKIKSIFDPECRLNPGNLFPLPLKAETERRAACFSRKAVRDTARP